MIDFDFDNECDDENANANFIQWILIEKHGNSFKYPLHGDNIKNDIIGTVQTIEKKKINSVEYRRMCYTGKYYRISFRHVTCR